MNNIELVQIMPLLIASLAFAATCFWAIHQMKSTDKTRKN